MDIEKALELFRSAETILSSKPPSAALAHTYVGLSSAALYGLQTTEGLQASARGIEIGKQLGREGLSATATALHGWLLWASGRLADGEQLIHRAWETADRLDHPTLGFVSTWMQAFVAETILDPRAGEAACDRELSRMRTSASLTQRDILTLHRDMLQAWRGDVTGLSAPAVPVGADVEVTIDVREQFLAYHLGDWPRAEELCRFALNHRRSAGNWLEIAATAHTLAWTLRMQGKLDEIEAVLGPCLPHTSGKFVGAELMERPELAVAFAQSGRLDEAHTQIAGCRLVLDEGEDWRGRGGFVRWAEGVVEAASGNYERAWHSFEEAATALSRYEAVIEHAEAHFWWGRALMEAGERSAALDKFETAVEIYRGSGAGQPFIDRVEAASS
jgi:tetratricopeptide (TPR) repeat protein